MSPSFAARWYAPDESPGGRVVQVHFSGGLMVIDATLRVGVTEIEAATGGFDDDGLVLRWQQQGQDHALIPVDADARRQLLDHAPDLLAPQLARWRGRVRGQRALWHLVLGGMAAILVLLVVGWWQYDHLVRWGADRIPLSTEQHLGERVLQQLRSQDHLIEHGEVVEAMRAIGARLTPDSRYRYRWFVKDDPSANAFAVPGGSIVVHRGLIERAASAEELASVLAHEVQHIEQRHSLQGMIHALGWASVLTVALGDASAMIGVLVHQAGTLSFGRELERAADLAGVQALHRAGIDPTGMVSFFRRLERTAPAGLSWLSSHPGIDERIADLERAIAGLPAQTAIALLPYDWAALRRSLPEAFEMAPPAAAAASGSGG